MVSKCLNRLSLLSPPLTISPTTFFQLSLSFPPIAPFLFTLQVSINSYTDKTTKKIPIKQYCSCPHVTVLWTLCPASLKSKYMQANCTKSWWNIWRKNTMNITHLADVQQYKIHVSHFPVGKFWQTFQHLEFWKRATCNKVNHFEWINCNVQLLIVFLKRFLHATNHPTFQNH